jgi:gamma-glutamyltranspeptidase/glutathione hydrolase
MSRFETNPRHPNAPGPGKRPVTNMCPSLVLRNGVPIMAAGGAGGVRIPNALFDLMVEYVVQGAYLEPAVAGPRLHCTGTRDVAVEPAWPKASAQYLKEVGFKVQTWESSCVVSAVTFDPENRECRGAIRGPAALGLEL